MVATKMFPEMVEGRVYCGDENKIQVDLLKGNCDREVSLRTEILRMEGVGLGVCLACALNQDGIECLTSNVS